MKQMKLFLLIFFIFFFNACQRDDATVMKYDKTLKKTECLSLSTSPFITDILLSSTLQKLYSFEKKCQYELRASQKSGIVCNSNQNASKKALTNFPSSFLRLDLYGNEKLLYSYYKDLNSKLTQEDIEKAFLRLKNDIGLEDAKSK